MLKDRRLSKYMTQEELAKRVGVKRTTVTMWENGLSKPTVPTAKKIAEVLGFDWTELFQEV